VKLPQRLKQTAIAEVLGSLDDRINSNLRVSHAAERLAVGKLAQLDRTVLLADIAESRREVRTDFDNTIVDHFSLPAFDAGRLPERCIGSSIKSGKSLMTEPVVLVSKLNPHIPRVWHALPEPGVMALASTEFCALRPKTDTTSQELWAACASNDFAASLLERVTGTTGSHQRVHLDDVLRVPVKDPRIATRHDAQVVVDLVDRAHAARVESVRLTSLRDALLPRLLSGALRVRDAETLVGEAA
jgi:type I restriction enzyme, S subunit